MKYGSPDLVGSINRANAIRPQKFVDGVPTTTCCGFLDGGSRGIFVVDFWIIHVHQHTR
jgi:hypothetical protein